MTIFNNASSLHPTAVYLLENILLYMLWYQGATFLEMTRDALDDHDLQHGETGLRYEVWNLYEIVQKGTIWYGTVLYSLPRVGLLAPSPSNTKSDDILLKQA